MRKFITMAMALCVVAMSAFAAAEPTKKQQSLIKKEVKAKLKELKKGDWAIFGSARTLEKALTEHISALITNEEAYEVSGFANNFTSKNVGHLQAVNNACISYAGMASSSIKGMDVTDMKSNSTNPGDEYDIFYATYQRNVEHEIKNEMKESFSIIHEVSPGIYEMQTFFIVDERRASQARERAALKAMQETNIAKENSEKISDYVRQSFER